MNEHHQINQIKPGDLMLWRNMHHYRFETHHIEFVLSVDPEKKERPTFAIVLQNNKIEIQKAPGLYWSAHWLKHE